MAAIGRAIELDPSDRHARRHAVTAHLEGGDLDGALRHGGQLLAMAPEEPEYLSCMRYLIEARGTQAATADFAGIAEAKALAPPRPPRRPARTVRHRRRSHRGSPPDHGERAWLGTRSR